MKCTAPCIIYTRRIDQKKKWWVVIICIHLFSAAARKGWCYKVIQPGNKKGVIVQNIRCLNCVFGIKPYIPIYFFPQYPTWFTSNKSFSFQYHWFSSLRIPSLPAYFALKLNFPSPDTRMSPPFQDSFSEYAECFQGVHGLTIF